MKGTTKAQADIVRRARAHLRAGGGLVATAAASDLDDVIGTVADAHFGATSANARFQRTLAGLDYDTHERIYAAAWQLITAHADAAFTLGAAMGAQAGAR